MAVKLVVSDDAIEVKIEVVDEIMVEEEVEVIEKVDVKGEVAVELIEEVVTIEE